MTRSEAKPSIDLGWKEQSKEVVYDAAPLEITMANTITLVSGRYLEHYKLNISKVWDNCY